MTRKAFLCRCEDLTVDECRQAIHDGYACFEDLKRFLGVGTGPCQGKSCVQAAMHLVAEERGIPLDAVDVMTFRPPVRPIAFATLAAADAPGATSGAAVATSSDEGTQRGDDERDASSSDASAATGGTQDGAAADRSARAAMRGMEDGP